MRGNCKILSNNVMTSLWVFFTYCLDVKSTNDFVNIFVYSNGDHFAGGVNKFLFLSPFEFY